MRPRLVLLWVVLGLLLHPLPGLPSESSVLVGEITRHVIARGETLTSLAAHFGVDAATIASDNRLARGQSLTPGRELLIDNRHIAPAELAAGEIVINVPQRMLFYRDGNRVLAYPTAVGPGPWDARTLSGGAPPRAVRPGRRRGVPLPWCGKRRTRRGMFPPRFGQRARGKGSRCRW